MRGTKRDRELHSIVRQIMEVEEKRSQKDGQKRMTEREQDQAEEQKRTYRKVGSN